MAYKDKEKQREAVRLAVQKHRKGITTGITPIEVDTEKAAKLLLICKACDREIHTLSGKKENILTMIRYGIGGPTLESVYQQLEPKLS